MLHERLIDALGPGAVKIAPEDLRAYSFDAYTQGRMPSAVVLPADVREISAVVKIAREFGEPIVPRGAGTGLCGGAVPAQGGIVVSFARMNRILAYERSRRRARVQPGLINAELSHAVARDGLFYAPDPSSQKISTIGGNVATNAGGPHCLSYGTTVNHVLGLEIVDERGEVYRTDDRRAGVRSDGRARRQRRNARHRERGVGASHAHTRSRARLARYVRRRGISLGRGLGDHRARHRADRARDDGRHRDESGRSGVSCGLSDRRGCRAAHRTCRASRTI